MRKVFIKFLILVYKSEEADIGQYTAHCLNLDIIADGSTVEGAIGNMTETIEAYFDAAEEHGAAPMFRPAPPEYFDRLENAQHVAPELLERIVQDANKRPGHKSTPISVKQQCDIQVEAACA